MEYEKRGYLSDNFRLFHINDFTDKTFDYHYHEFDKAVIMLEGDVKYIVEGSTYTLHPGDITLVRHNEIHRPIINPQVRYDRYVIYITPQYISRGLSDDTSLSSCFENAAAKGEHVLSPAAGYAERIQSVLCELEGSISSEKFASKLYSSALFVQLMVLINRVTMSSRPHLVSSDPKDERIASLLRFINDNLTEDMTIERLSRRSYISRYHLMRIFREATGETIHSYVRKKRLMRAAELIRQGVPVIKASEECGFSDYSTFSRAFKSLYGMSPTALMNSDSDLFDGRDIFDY